MASKISALILTEVIPRLQITSADARLTYANLLSYTQKVYEDLYYAIIDQNPELYGLVGYVASNANSTSAALSANLTSYDKAQTFLKVDMKRDTNGKYYTASEVSWHDLNNPQATFSNTSPVFALLGDDIHLRPQYTAAVVSAARLYYTQTASNLSGGTAHNLPSGFENAFVNGVAYYGFQHLGQSAKATQFFQDYQIEKQKKIAQINNRSKTRKIMKDIRSNYFGTYYNS